MRMRWRRPTPGSVQPDTWAIANPAESAFCAPYGFADPSLIRVAVPTVTQIEVRGSSKVYRCGHYTEVSSLLADASRKKIEEEESKKGFTPGPLKHIYYQLSMGPQVTAHFPYPHSSTHFGAEVDAVVQSAINLVFHDDAHAGFEAAFALQGSNNYSFVDPNRYDPNETFQGRFSSQYQRQIQMGAFFPNWLGVKNLTFGIFVQYAGSTSLQYDPSQRSPQFSTARIAGPGLGFNYQLSDTVSLGFQPTLGVNEGAVNTIDSGFFFFLQAQKDILP